MNRRIIGSILSNKFDKFVNSIEDKEVKELVRKNTIITGGCIASLLLKEKVNDFDLYFTNFETVVAVSKYYLAEFNKRHSDMKIPPKVRVNKDTGRVDIFIKSAGIAGENTDDSQYQYFEGRPLEDGENYVSQAIDNEDLQGSIVEEELKTPYRPVFLTSNAITLSDRVQLIIRFYGDADEIHKNFDFVHATSYWESATGKLTLRPAALESLLARQLFYIGSLFPVSSMIRTRKFIKRNWHINAGSLLKIALQISELDLTDISVLQDQLTGVDSAYFVQLLDALKEKQEKEPEFKVTMEYITAIIDKVFQ